MSDDDVSHTTNELLSHVGFDICNSYSEELLNNPQVTLADNSDDSFIVFTTRCDTLFGATYCVLSPEHPLVKKITSKEKATLSFTSGGCLTGI